MIALIAIAGAACTIWVAEAARERANEQTQAAIELMNSLNEGRALNFSMLVDGLSALQDRDDDSGYELLEMLLRHEMTRLRSSNQTPNQEVSESLQKAEAYLEKLEG